MSSKESELEGKAILIVDDEPDILDVVEQELDMCFVDKAENHDIAMQYLANRTYDIVILDIMGVNGFDLLRDAVDKGFATVMLTAHALSPEALKKSMKLGAVAFLPKDQILELKPFLEEVLLGGGKPIWKKLFDKLGGYFGKHFGPDWMEKDEFFREFKEEMWRQEPKNDE